MTIADIFLIRVEPNFSCCKPYRTLLIWGQILFKREGMMNPSKAL